MTAGKKIQTDLSSLPQHKILINWNTTKLGQSTELYSIHRIVKDTSVPQVYCLMKNKSREKYEEIFSASKNLNAILDPHEIIIEFAIAAIEAPKLNFQNANIKGCFFRFAQANWRKIQSVGLAVEYQENAEVRNLLKCFASLALIPESNIPLGFEKLKRKAVNMKMEKLDKFVDYFKCTWLGRKSLRGRRTGASFLPKVWCPYANAKEMRQKKKTYRAASRKRFSEECPVSEKRAKVSEYSPTKSK